MIKKQRSRYKAQGTRYKVQGTRFKVQEARNKNKTQSPKNNIQGIQYLCATHDSSDSSLDFWTLGFGFYHLQTLLQLVPCFLFLESCPLYLAVKVIHLLKQAISFSVNTNSDMKNIFRLLPFVFMYVPLFAQQKNYAIEVTAFPAQQRVVITVNHQPFTEFIYPDSLPKPVLFPIYAPGGQLVTRGFPLAARTGEPTDHPHHYGLWLNYENSERA